MKAGSRFVFSCGSGGRGRDECKPFELRLAAPPRQRMFGHDERSAATPAIAANSVPSILFGDMNGICMCLWQWLRSKFLFLVWLGLAILPPLGLRWVKENYSEPLPSLVMTILIIGYIVYCAVTFYILISAIHYLNEDPAVSFLGAVKRGIGSLKMLLRFIPVIGSLFEPDEDKTHPDPDDE